MTLNHFVWPTSCNFFHKRITRHDRNDEMRMKKLFEGNSTSKCYASRRQETRSWNRIWKFQQSKYHTYHSLTVSYLPKFSRRRTKVHLKLHEKNRSLHGTEIEKILQHYFVMFSEDLRGKGKLSWKCNHMKVIWKLAFQIYKLVLISNRELLSLGKGGGGVLSALVYKYCVQLSEKTIWLLKGESF